MIGNRIVIVRTCDICEKQGRVANVPREQYNDWKNGIDVKKAFPDLNRDQRNWIESSICPVCIEKICKIGKRNQERNGRKHFIRRSGSC